MQRDYSVFGIALSIVAISLPEMIMLRKVFFSAKLLCMFVGYFTVCVYNHGVFAEFHKLLTVLKKMVGLFFIFLGLNYFLRYFSFSLCKIKMLNVRC